MKCDFCSSPSVAVCYPAYSSRLILIPDKDGEIRGIGDSIGGWAACVECAQLIEAGDHEGLAKRSAETFPLVTSAGLSRAEITLIVRQIQEEMFWAQHWGPGIFITGSN